MQLVRDAEEAVSYTHLDVYKRQLQDIVERWHYLDALRHETVLPRALEVEECYALVRITHCL